MSEERVKMFSGSDRVFYAVNALSAVRDLCVEASNSRFSSSTLGHVDADCFAALLQLIINEMREAEEDLRVERESAS